MSQHSESKRIANGIEKCHRKLHFPMYNAVGVKRSPNLGPDDVRAQSAFKEEYPEATCIFVIPGKRIESYRGFPVVPMEEFLLGITPENPIFPS